jgi:hypothetical protein
LSDMMSLLRIARHDALSSNALPGFIQDARKAALTSRRVGMLCSPERVTE